MKVSRILLPAAAENCYLAINENTNKAIIIDPGSAFMRIKSAVDQLNVTPVAILLTHGHFDHAGEAATTASEYGIKIYAHEAAKEELESPSYNLSGDMFGDREVYHADAYLKDDDEAELGGLSFRCLFTPGHTKGGCCYYFYEDGVIFTGDTLFCGSVGRTDFPGGSMSTLVNSIQTKLLTLPDDTVCYPGHDAPTTVGEERMGNPFIV